MAWLVLLIIKFVSKQSKNHCEVNLIYFVRTAFRLILQSNLKKNLDKKRQGEKPKLVSHLVFFNAQIPILEIL